MILAVQTGSNDLLNITRREWSYGFIVILNFSFGRVTRLSCDTVQDSENGVV
jgi:hypothetical protein